MLAVVLAAFSFAAFALDFVFLISAAFCFLASLARFVAANSISCSSGVGFLAAESRVLRRDEDMLMK